MNYLKIYKQLMTRAKQEGRKKGCGVYYEKHHIIPDFMFYARSREGQKGHLPGDPDDKVNLVLLTAREHILSHILLFKIHDGKRYGYQHGAALNFFFSKVMNKHTRSINFRGSNSRFYEYCREVGAKSMSNINKGKINVRHALTGVYYGRMLCSDPRVISGEYVHHSKGSTFSESRKQEYSEKYKGSGNSNYKEMTIERRARVLLCAERAIEDGYIKTSIFTKEIKLEFTEFKKVSMVWVSNNFCKGGTQKDLLNAIVNELNQTNGTDYKYGNVRSIRQKNNIRKSRNDYIKHKNGDIC